MKTKKQKQKPKPENSFFLQLVCTGVTASSQHQLQASFVQILCILEGEKVITIWSTGHVFPLCMWQSVYSYAILLVVRTVWTWMWYWHFRKGVTEALVCPVASKLGHSVKSKRKCKCIDTHRSMHTHFYNVLGSSNLSFLPYHTHLHINSHNNKPWPSRYDQIRTTGLWT